ncbi:MAG: sulfite exporter TauE/SafE family protein [Candidatus Colwellbacteria bacterium]|nr:sulfite exporter TauE/SafE family protein [Candidatus Colwellbacteria bacterium]
MDVSLVIPAFIAGILTFLAPCTLPLVPAYLGFISGTSIDDLEDPARSAGARWRIFLNGLFFVIGFSMVFIVLGTLVGLVGSTVLAPYRLWLSRIGGVFVIIFGLFMLNVVKIPFLTAERTITVPPIFERGRPLNSLILGSAFAFGWTPCVGPILGSILLLASTSTTALQGGLLLTVFSAGLAVPFLLTAVAVGHASRYIANLSRFLNVVSVVGGIFLIGLGLLLLTGNVGLLISWGYRLLEFVNYDALLNYL